MACYNINGLLVFPAPDSIIWQDLALGILVVSYRIFWSGELRRGIQILSGYLDSKSLYTEYGTQ